MKKKLVFVSFLICIALCFAFAFANFFTPATAYATGELPFTLVAPANVNMTKSQGDAPTTMSFSYSLSNEITEFFTAYDASGDGAAYLASLGITDYDEIWLGIQIDWALDDVNDAVSGWHYNAYWEQAGVGVLGTDTDGKYHYSCWDVVDSGIDATQTVNNAWLYRGMNEYDWLGNETVVGLRDQLNSSQYTFAQYEHDGDVTLNINWDAHTIYSRVRFVVTTLDTANTEQNYYFSDWSSVVAYGKDAQTFEPLHAGDIPAPVITGLRLTDEQFSDNPVVAFTLTVPDTLAAQAAQVAAAGGIIRVEAEARVKGTSAWTNLNLAGEVQTGELNAYLVYLATPGQVIPEGTEIELRARYLCMQPEQEDFYSEYSKIIGFGSDDIIGENPQYNNGGAAATENGETAKHKCKICGFCPEPLGLCIFIWLVIIIVILAVGVTAYIIIKKKIDKSKQEK